MDIPSVARAALARAQDLLFSWYPDGKLEGREFKIGDVAGKRGRSCSINVETGAWMDGATGEKGGDLVSLLAAREGLSQLEASEILARMLGLVNGSRIPNATIAQPRPDQDPPAIPVSPPLIKPNGHAEGFTGKHVRHGMPAVMHQYRDETDELTHYVARYEFTDESGHRAKEFCPWTFNGDDWVAKAPPAPRPLYGLQFLQKSAKSTVLLVEGEKSCDAARRVLGVEPNLPITWMGGSQAHSKADWAPLAGRKVNIWPDADPAGWKAATALLERLAGMGCKVSVIDTTDHADGWDVADAVAEGWSKLDILTYAKKRKVSAEVWDELQDALAAKMLLEASPKLERAAALADDEGYMQALAEAEPVRDDRNVSSAIPQKAQKHAAVAITRCAADIVTREIEQLWPGVLYIGKPTLLVGDPGLSKSLMSLDVAARVTTGAAWPLGGENPGPGNVLICSAEDDPEDTIVPRLKAAGADLTRIEFLEGVRELDAETGEPVDRPVVLDRHMGQIGEIAEKMQGRLKLLLVDPVAAFLGETDSHKNSEIRALLSALAHAANKYRFAVLVISHLNKSVGANAIYRISGSLAFVAAARAAFAVVRDPENAERRMMLPVKNNLAIDTEGFSYQINVSDDDTPYVAWGEEAVTSATAEQIMGSGEQTTRADAVNARVQEVIDWLKDQLQKEAQPAASLWRASEQQGFTERDVKRAKKFLGVQASIKGYQGDWHWSLPVKKGRQN